jgi:cytochrome c oxidase subunit I
VFLAGFSSIFTGINFLVTIHKMRAPGMTWFRLPLFVWAMYATSLLQVLGTPVVAITLLLVAVERSFRIGIFDPNLGGDPILFQHLFWFYSHPAVYIMILPAMGVISEVISAFSKRRVFGYHFVAFSSLAIAIIGFLVWGHHMFSTGQSIYAGIVFSFLTWLVAVPSAIKIFNWMATIWKGRVHWDTPMLYALGFMGLFVIGGLDGLALGGDGDECAPDRHLLRRGALPLCDGGRRDYGLPCRAPLLVAEDDGAHVPRRLGQAGSDARVRRVQPDLLPAVHLGLHGHAAPLPQLP